MSDASYSSAAIVEKWLMRAESVAASIPSWIPSARQDLAELVPPLSAVESALARASLAPPSVRPRSSLIPALTAISIQPEPALPAYPDLRDENATLRRQLAEMAVSTARLRADLLETNEAELVRLACTVAERAVGRELEADPTLAIGWAREAIEAAGAKEDVVVAVGPELASLVTGDEWSARLGTPARIEIDPSLGALGCEVRTRASVVDASARGRVGAIARELGVAAE